LTDLSGVSGASMDVVIPKKRGKQLKIVVVVVALVALLGVGFWRWTPVGLQVATRSVRIEVVERGTFKDEVIVRAYADSLKSVNMDSVESGRVEEVFVQDGVLVKKGDKLFRLSNSQRLVDLLARQSDEAQQVSNALNLRVALETARSTHRQRITELEYSVLQAQRQFKRNQAAGKYVSKSLLEDSADQLAHQTRLLREEKLSAAAEIASMSDAARQMDQAIDSLRLGLKVINSTVDALTVRAPVAGRLADFSLGVGQTVKPDQHIGRIDDPTRFKLLAKVDEYYVNRIAVGAHGGAHLNGLHYSVKIARVYQQIRQGQFAVEFLFDSNQPTDLSPGQSLEASITMAEPAQTLILPNGAFFNDTGGTWVFIVNQSGAAAERRAVRFGRRSLSQIEVLSGLSPGDKVIVSGYAEFGNSTRLQLR